MMSASSSSPVSSRMMLCGWTALMLAAGFLFRELFENVTDTQLGAKALKSTSGMMKQEEKGGVISMDDHDYGNNTTTTTTTTSQRQPQQHGLEFVFTMGLEGTGHHFMHTVVEKSPHWATLKRLKIADHATKLSDLLWRDRTLGGLWNIPCLDIKNWKKGSSNANHESGDSVAKHRQIVQELKSIQTIYNNNASRTQRQPLRFPVNTMLSSNAGMLSYPNYMNPPACRSLNYPVIDLLFSACDEAQVQCSYVYTYRHPLDILNSTVTERHYNAPGMVAATHMYTSLLRIMKAQMEASQSRIRGCLGFFEKDEATTYEWQSILRDMWGYKADTFDKFFQANYKPPKIASKNSTSKAINFHEVNDEKFPAKHIPYLEVFLKAHEKTLNVCKQLMLQLQQPGRI